MTRLPAAEDLRKLEPDVASAHDDEVLGQHLEIHHRHVGEIGGAVDAGKGRHARPPANIHENLAGGELGTIHLDRVGAREPRMTVEHLAVLEPVHPVFEAVAGGRDDGVLTRLHPTQVDARCT